MRHEDILPAETITYTKGAQTDPLAELEPKEGEEGDQEDGADATAAGDEEQAGEGDAHADAKGVGVTHRL